MTCSTNIVTANFGGGKREATTAPLYQWDYGQVLCIAGLDALPQTFEVHFATQKNGGVSTTVVGIDGRVDVPNVLLTIGKDIHAWIYLSDTTGDGETEYAITIPVKARPMPEYYDAEATGVFDGVVRQVGEYAEEASAAAERAATSASAAAQSASAAAASEESASESADRAEYAMRQAISAQNEATTQATIATEKASQASGYATAAAQSATSAEQSKTAAANAATAAGQAASAAGNSAATATTKATDAAASASDAAQSATAATTASTNAAASATDASASATAAAASATAASGSAQTASTAAQTATTKAAEASASATAAEAAKNTAVANATTATEKAAEAAQSASGVAQSKTDAEAAAARAEQAAASLTVDSALSDSSTNPVQNKVITGELTDVKSALNDVVALPITWTDGKAINPINGNIVDDERYRIATFPVSLIRGGTIKGVTGMVPSTVIGIAFYDDNGSFISGAYNTTEGTYKYAYTLTVPTNAATMRVSLRIASADLWEDPTYSWDVRTGILSDIAVKSKVFSGMKYAVIVPVLRNGSAANTGNANGVCPANVLPINGADKITVLVSKTLSPNADFRRFQYSTYSVSSGLPQGGNRILADINVDTTNNGFTLTKQEYGAAVGFAVAYYERTNAQTSVPVRITDFADGDYVVIYEYDFSVQKIDNYVIGTDLLKRAIDVELLGILSAPQSFLRYNGNYYSTDGSTVYVQDDTFAVINTAALSLGHANAFHLGTPPYAYASGWGDNTVYKVDLDTLTIVDTINLPTTGYTTCAVDDVNGLIYIFQRESSSAVERYNFLTYDYINETVVSTKKIFAYGGMQACDFYNDRIVMVYGLATTAVPNGYKVLDTSGNVLADYFLPNFSAKEPEGVCIDRDTHELYIGFYGNANQRVYKITSR